ncbi:YciI family protein [Chryseobacterium proteolyticum]|uniref:YciI family protein n=1 Tax=Chryseobacterium proteolyticum TaxID=118127 RepID=UPI003983B309
MKKFIVLFREPDGRTIQHPNDDIKAHQENWKNWFSTWGQKGKLEGGSGLTLEGRMIKDNGNTVTNEIYKNHHEIVGGYLLLKCTDFDEAVEIMKTCPIYEFDGYAEIRELQNQD